MKLRTPDRILRSDLGRAEIPTLGEVYDLLKGSGMTINVEIKSGIIFYKDIEEKVLKLTAEKGLEDVVIYSSFNHASMVKCKQLNSQAKCGLLYADGTLFMEQYAKQLGMDYLHPALYNLQYEGFVDASKKADIPLHVWTVNEETHIRKVYELGVAAVITNYPDLCLELRKGKK